MGIYLDNNATTHLDERVRACIAETMARPVANASSAHSAGDRTRRLVEQAREQVAQLIGGLPERIFFNSGCTEGNNQVLMSAIRGHEPARIVTTAVEHSSVLKTCEHLESLGHTVVYLPVDGGGCIDLSDLSRALQLPVDLVSVQWTNNETGVIMPIEEIGALCRQANVRFHTDAAQAVGKLSMRVSDLPIDFLTLSGHKLHAPPGIGAVYCAEQVRLTPLLHGGPQEEERRPGTENILGIVGLGAAAAIRINDLHDYIQHAAQLRDEFEAAVLARIPGTSVNGDRNHRVCNSTNLRFAGTNGEALVAQLDLHDIFCSQSSACTNSRPEPSYVLRAMGLNEEEAYDSVRFSFSAMNTRAEVSETINILDKCCSKLRAFNGTTLEPMEVAHA